MTDRQLKHLSRKELLELLVEQSRELESVQTQLARAQEQLEEREILLSRAGSIAEASLALNHVFQAAEAAGQQYVNSLCALYQRERDRIEGAKGGDES